MDEGIVANLRTPDDPTIIKRLSENGWRCHVEGADGLGRWIQAATGRALIESRAIEDDGCLWSHISISNRGKTMPTWEQMRDAVWLLWPHKYAIIVIAPKTKHVSIAEVHHAWVNLSKPTVPDFTRGGNSI